MRVILYCRVSTADQANHGVSLDAQRAKLTAYASLFDLEVVEVIEDAGESAKSLRRPGLQRALDMLKSGKADGIAVAKLDRLTRSVADWQTLIDGYFSERAGKQLFSVADSIDTRTATGRMVLGILMVVSQAERELIGERTTAALRFKISKGERCGKVRYGFNIEGKQLVPNAAEQAAIQTMKELRQSGMTLRGIKQELAVRGIRSKDGKEWSEKVIASIIRRESVQAA
jgi:site-specific DNA recombinase